MKLFHTLFLTTILFLSTNAFAGKININSATAEQIATAMTGIGESKAKAIVEYRSSHGKFKSVQDLENVDGIGSKTIENNKANITL
jgi:competence protein ComEA